MSNACWPGGVPQIMPAEDRGEIAELYARYAWGIDLADEEQAIATFARDAEFDHLWQGKVQGHDAIRENLRSLWYDRQHWWYGRQHLMNQFIMDPHPQGARVRCFSRSSSGTPITAPISCSASAPEMTGWCARTGVGSSGG